MPEAVDVTVAGPIPQDQGRDNLWLYVRLALLATAGFFYVNISPSFQVAFSQALGFSDGQAGFAISANIFGMAFGGLIAVYLVRRFDWRPMLTGLLAGMLVLELWSMTVSGYGAMWPLRALDGVIGGASVGVALSLLGRTRFPDRAFAMLLMFQFACGGLGNWLLPDWIDSSGAWVVFATMAGMNLLAVLTALTLRLPADEAGRDTSGGKVAIPATAPVAVLVVAALVALFLFQTAEDGVLAFIFGLAEARGLASGFAHQTVGTTTWIGAAGALFVIVVGVKAGRVVPVSVAMIVAVMGMATFLLADHASAFYAANVMSAITWSAVVPYLFGMVARLDRNGHLATLAGFSSGAGLAFGPALAGYAIEQFGYTPFLLVSVAFLVVAGLVAIPAAIRVDAIDRPQPTGD